MKLFGRGDAKEKERRDFVRNVVTVTAANRAHTLPSQQQINSLGTAYFLQQDENVVKIITEHCPELLPAFSRMNATSKIDTPRDRQIMQLLFEDLLLHQEMELGDEGDIATRSLIKSLRINAEFRILDAMQGYRGKLITEEIERSTHIIEEPKKKRLL